MLAGFGCAPDAAVDLPTSPPVNAPPHAPYFIAYSSVEHEKALGEGRVTLLFFTSGASGNALLPRIAQVVKRMDFPVAGFAADYDSFAELKRTFNVNYPNTVIILDGKGDEVIRHTGAESPFFIEAGLRRAAGGG